MIPMHIILFLPQHFLLCEGMVLRSFWEAFLMKVKGLQAKTEKHSTVSLHRIVILSPRRDTAQLEDLLFVTEMEENRRHHSKSTDQVPSSPDSTYRI